MLAQFRRDGAVFQRGDQTRQRPPVAGFDLVQGLGRVLAGVGVADRQHVVDHALQAHGLTVFRREDAGHAVFVQLADFRRHDHATAAAEHLDVVAAALAQQVDHVLEEFDMAALVGTDRDALRVLLQGGGDDVVHRAVVAEMDDFRAAGLEDAAHDVDGGVMAVEQAGGGHKADLVLGPDLVGAGHGGFELADDRGHERDSPVEC